VISSRSSKHVVLMGLGLFLYAESNRENGVFFPK